MVSVIAEEHMPVKEVQVHLRKLVYGLFAARDVLQYFVNIPQ